MDASTITGLMLAWTALVASTLMEGGDLRIFVNLPAAILVFGGTIGAAISSFKQQQLANLPSVIKIAISGADTDYQQVIETMVKLASKARREGLLALEAASRSIDDDFLRHGIRLVVDGSDPDSVRDILSTEISSLESRHKVGAQFFSTMGGFAPTLGIIGTVMGLVHMLARLNDPGKMGPLIAGAFTATLYGVTSANLVFIPMSNKLKQRSADEVVAMEIMLEGILAIQSGDNPRIVERKLNAFLPPAERQSILPAGEVA